jgi:hypothetical protein
MDFNLFHWIREGVRRSVMLGVADAIESVGSPATGEDLHKSLQHFRSRIDAPTDKPVSGGNASAGVRKRLGRTLKDLDATK